MLPFECVMYWQVRTLISVFSTVVRALLLKEEMKYPSLLSLFCLAVVIP